MADRFLVIGGGLVGTYLATTLGRNGAKVVLKDIVKPVGLKAKLCAEANVEVVTDLIPLARRVAAAAAAATPISARTAGHPAAAGPALSAAAAGFTSSFTSSITSTNLPPGPRRAASNRHPDHRLRHAHAQGAGSGGGFVGGDGSLFDAVFIATKTYHLEAVATELAACGPALVPRLATVGCYNGHVLGVEDLFHPPQLSSSHAAALPPPPHDDVLSSSRPSSSSCDASTGSHATTPPPPPPPSPPLFCKALVPGGYSLKEDFGGFVVTNAGQPWSLLSEAPELGHLAGALSSLGVRTVSGRPGFFQDTRKFLVNVTANLLSVTARTNCSGLFGSHQLVRRMRAVLSEAIAVLRASPAHAPFVLPDAPPPPSLGPSSSSPAVAGAEEAAAAAAAAELQEEVLAGIASYGSHYPSSCQDFMAGRPIEVASLNGYIVALGASLGVPTPHNAALVADTLAAIARQEESMKAAAADPISFQMTHLRQSKKKEPATMAAAAAATTTTSTATTTAAAAPSSEQQRCPAFAWAGQHSRAR